MRFWMDVVVTLSPQESMIVYVYGLLYCSRFSNKLLGCKFSLSHLIFISVLFFLLFPFPAEVEK
jgi:hypothetical protein